MEGIADYKAESDHNTRDKHGLEVGDVLSGGIGSDKEIVEIDEDGVRFGNGETTPHSTLAHNIEQVNPEIK